MLWEFMGPVALYLGAMTLFTFLLRQHAEYEKPFVIKKLGVFFLLVSVISFLLGIYGLGLLGSTLLKFSFGPDVPLRAETPIIVMASWLLLLFVIAPIPFYIGPAAQPRIITPRLKNLWLWLTSHRTAMLV